MVLVSYGDIHLHKVSRKYLKVFKLQSGHIYYRNHYFQCSKGHDSKNRLSRVRVLMGCTSSYDALHLCEFFRKWFQSYRADMSTWKYLEQFTTYRVDTITW